MGKTVVPIKTKDYTIVSGSINVENDDTVISFDKKIIGLFITYTLDSKNYYSGYYVNPDLTFWENIFNDFIYNSRIYFKGSANVHITKVSDYDVNLYYSDSSTSNVISYVAILEDNEVNVESIFLLSNTILLTDGLVTSDVADAIQTVDTNQYKIKSNALVNISNATYINLSN